MKRFLVILSIFVIAFYAMLPMFGCGARVADNFGFYSLVTPNNYRVTYLGVVEIACRR